MSTISRVGFCEKCFKKGNPKDGQYYSVVGTNNIYVRIAEKTKGWNTGFVPHFYSIVKVIGQNVIYEKSCGIHECGGHVTIYTNENEKETATWTIDETTRGVMTIEQWNSLVKYKDKSYHL